LMQKIEKIIYFTSPSVMNIRGIGRNIIIKLLNENLLNSPIDLYKLSLDQLLSIKNINIKTANNIFWNIKNSKYSTLNRFLLALDIPQLGKNKIFKLIEFYVSIENLLKIDLNDLVLINNIGITLFNNIYDYIQINKSYILEFRKFIIFITNN
jgi:DNA ligase (NAD+)